MDFFFSEQTAQVTRVLLSKLVEVWDGRIGPMHLGTE